MADEIFAKDSSNYEKTPEGSYHAVCVDVIDLGYRYNRKFDKTEQKCAIIFQTVEKGKAGKRYEIAAVYTITFSEKANLRKFLAQWRGKSYSDVEATVGAPLHKLEGKAAYITVEHRTSGDKTYANIIGIMKAPPGLPELFVENYTRSANWKKTTEAEAHEQWSKQHTPEVPKPAQPAPDFEDFPDPYEDSHDEPLPF